MTGAGQGAAVPDLQSLDGQIAWCIANLHRLPLIGILTNLRLLAEQRAALSPASNTACATCGHEADHHSKDCGFDCHHAECYVTGCSCRRYVAALSPASGGV